jgi:peroxiredoxin
MRNVFVLVCALCIASPAANRALAAAAETGQEAPSFTLKDSNGREHSLSDFKGKYVVLEWVNFDCPFVHKHYGSGNMQKLQRMYTEKGVAWLSVCSSAPGKQGHFEGDALKERIASEQSVPTAYLIDADGRVGQLYGAKATPHMFVINPEGLLLYAGAIDDIASTNKTDITKATNYVREVLDAALVGKPIDLKTTRAYGCSVKYK